MKPESCVCHPNAMCGRCSYPDIASALLAFEESERSPNPRRDDEEWCERVRMCASANGYTQEAEEEEAA
jgi:hypothetical protein